MSRFLQILSNNACLEALSRLHEEITQVDIENGHHSLAWHALFEGRDMTTVIQRFSQK